MSVAGGDLLAPAGHAHALGRCTAVPRAEFAERVWGRGPSVSRAADLPGPPAFRDLFSLTDADRLLARQGLRSPFLRMAKNGTTLPTTAFTSPGGVGAGIADQVDEAKVAAQFAAGATIVLQGLHRTHPPLEEFGRRLCRELGHPVQVNSYVTPPASQGFSAHYDVHDVFVLQVAGRKRWLVHAPVLTWPLRDQPWVERRDSVRAAGLGEPALDVVLDPGDSLYLPRGWLHAAHALGENSAHLTVGVHTWTRRHLLEDVLRALADVEELRAPLPLGIDVADPGQIAAELTTTLALAFDAAAQIPAAAVAGRLAAAAAAATRPEPFDPIAQISAAAHLAPDSLLRWRDGVPADRALPGGAAAAAAAADPRAELRLRRGDRVRAGDLGLPAAAAALVAGLVVTENP